MRASWRVSLSVALACCALVCIAASCDRPGDLPGVPDTIRAGFEGYTIHDLARYLAARPEGLPARFDAAVAVPAYRDAAERMATAWRRYEREHLAKLRAWRGELKGKASPEVFYPFGGPDAVHPVSLFPEARRYHLFGLERVGRVPRLDFADPAAAARQASLVHGAVRGVLGRNFFLTLAMTGTVGGSPDSGVGAILLFFLARLDCEIIDAYPIMLTADGEIVPAKEGRAVQGMRVLFRGPRAPADAADTFADADAVRELNYFQLNISDANLPKTPGLRAWLERRRDLTTMLKAASYLLYLDAFDDVRGVILERSRLVLSDPSGMPFHFLNTEDWRLTPYGMYLGPIGLFPVRYEPDRRAFYARERRRALPFAYGYHPTNPSVLLAERRAPLETRPLVFDGHDTEGITTFFRNGRQVILGSRERRRRTGAHAD